jgi:hypothetical protein
LLTAVQILSVLLVAVAMTPALAHALEAPGKRRLSKATYTAIQKIYYPGFTAAGVAEPLAILAIALLLIVTPTGTASFWLAVAALGSVLGMHAVYWTVTHPVNKVWLQGETMSAAGSRFFAAASARGAAEASARSGAQAARGGPTAGAGGSAPADASRSALPADRDDWETLRDRWEHSHVARAGFAVVAFVALLVALSPAA